MEGELKLSVLHSQFYLLLINFLSPNSESKKNDREIGDFTLTLESSKKGCSKTFVDPESSPGRLGVGVASGRRRTTGGLARPPLGCLLRATYVPKSLSRTPLSRRAELVYDKSRAEGNCFLLRHKNINLSQASRKTQSKPSSLYSCSFFFFQQDYLRPRTRDKLNPFTRRAQRRRKAE